MPKYDTRQDARKDDIIAGINKADTIESLVSWVGFLFNLGDEKQIDLRIEKTKAFLNVFEYAKTLEPGSYDAASAAKVLDIFRSDPNIASNVDGGGDSGYTTGDIWDLQKQLVESQTADLSFPELKDSGKAFVENLSEETITSFNEINKQQKNIEEGIAKAKYDAIYKNYTENGSPYDKLDTTDIWQEYSAKITELEYWLDEQFKEAYKIQDQDKYALERDRITKEFNDKKKVFQKEYYAKKEKVTAIADEIIKNIEEKATAELRDKLDSVIKQRKELSDKIQNEVIGKIIDQSPISQEDAEKWFTENVFVAKNALDRMKRTNSPYNSMDEIKADMIEFYRIIGGKIGKIRIETSGGRRANAPLNGVVNIDSNFSKRVLWHEMAHHVEYKNTVINIAAESFRNKRAGEGAKKVRLSTLARNAGYGSDEYALPDNFFNPYVGKVYRLGITEVVSMGLEQLASPEHILDLYNRDREHLELVIGMAVKRDYAVEQLLNVEKFHATSEIAKAGLKEEFEKELKRVATKTSIDDKYLVPNRESGNAPWMEKYRNVVYVYLEKDDEGKFPATRLKSLQDARNFLYLFLSNREGLINNRSWYSRYEIEEIVNGKLPSWFTSGMKLPKLSN